MSNSHCYSLTFAPKGSARFIHVSSEELGRKGFHLATFKRSQDGHGMVTRRATFERGVFIFKAEGSR